MVFSSPSFLFLFLPAFLGAYYLTPTRYRSVTILAGSWIFYGWWRLDFLGLLIVTTAVNYAASLAIDLSRSRKLRLRYLALAVAFDLFVLGYFKYFNFFVDSVAAVMWPDGSIPSIARIVLPIGISFYVFQAISYVVDVYRRDAPPASSFVDFAAFIALFPQLIAGPVLRYKDLAPQFAERTHSVALFAEGSRRFVIGLAKKVLLADGVAAMADAAFAASDPTFMDAWLGALAYAVQLYFDFSGYSDMAIGLGLMLGFRYTENFRFPYVSQSITEFWRRWHISLSTWLRDYLYVPLGGNRRGRRRTYVNLLITMVLGGVWHGANWTFLIWGAWHGALLALERLAGVRVGIALYPRLLALPITLTVVIIGWVMFRAPDVAAALVLYQGMVGANGFWLSDDLAWQIGRADLAVLALAWAIAFAEPALSRIEWERAAPIFQSAGVTALAVLAVLKVSAATFSPFLYFQF